MLGTLPPNKMFTWRYMVLTPGHAYNCTRSTATGLSPYYLMYGQQPHLPLNLCFGTQKAEMNAVTSTKFVQQLCERLNWAYKIAQHVIEKETRNISETMTTNKMNIWKTHQAIHSQVDIFRVPQRSENPLWQISIRQFYIIGGCIEIIPIPVWF